MNASESSFNSYSQTNFYFPPYETCLALYFLTGIPGMPGSPFLPGRPSTVPEPGSP